MAETTTSTGYSILLVDDSDDIRDIYQTFLAGAGYTVYTAQNGAEGLDSARKYNPSLILLDLMMPVMDGREMLKQLKADETLKNIPVLIFSALITELERQECLDAGAAEYIEKSNVEDPAQLLELIKPYLGKSAA